MTDGIGWAKESIKSKEAKSLTAQEILWDLGILCDTGVETTGMQLQNFILACVAYPAWAVKAQKELDDVVGGDRLPEFDDLSKLPYLQAVVEENFRWRHIVPAGIPHATAQDDYHKGYLIPKGSVVVPVFSAMRHDQSVCDASEDFQPERWVGRAQPSNFGYGRRLCPGRFIARNSLAISMAKMLWTFHIQAENDTAVTVKEDMFTTGFVSGPKPFVAQFQPRSPRHKTIIENHHATAEKEVVRLMNGARERQAAAGSTPRA